MTSLDLSNQVALSLLVCGYNNLYDLDLSSNVNLTSLWCENNDLVGLDITNNPFLNIVICLNNDLLSLDLRNGSFASDSLFVVHENNPYLFCINVDDVFYASNYPWVGDSHHYYDTDCNGTTLIDVQNLNKDLIRRIDILGRETKRTKNQPLFYLYDDGTVEKRIILE